MELSEEQLKELEKLAGAGWSLKKLAIYFGVTLKTVEREFQDKDGDFRRHYDKGIIDAEARITLTVSDALEHGSVTAAQMLEKKLREQKLNNFKAKLLDGHH